MCFSTFKDCPTSCECIQPTQNELHVMCGSRDLTKVPSSMPTETTELDLSHNFIQELNADDFNNCYNLSSLDISHNILRYKTTLTNNPLKPLVNLKSVRLQGNNAYDKTVKNADFKKLLDDLPSRIKRLEVDIPSSTTKFVPYFQKFSMLSELGMYGKIKNLANFTLSPLSLMKIKTFRCQLQITKKIEPLAFHGLENVTVLDMSGSSLRRESDLKDLSLAIGLNNPKLTTLKLTSLNTKKPGCFGMNLIRGLWDLKYLEKLHLDRIGISSCDGEYLDFSQIMKLKFVTLAHSKFNVRSFVYAFYRNSELRHLDLSYQGGIEYIVNRVGEFHFDLSNTMSTLNLSGINHIVMKDYFTIRLIGENELQFFEFRSNSIQTLTEFIINKPNNRIPLTADFSQNNLNRIDADCFKKSVDWGLILDGLYLSGNHLEDQLRNESQHFLRDLNHLTVLDLSINAIKILPSSTFVKQTNVRSLNFSRNYLVSLDFEFAHMLNLSLLDLSDNHFASFNEQTRTTIDRLNIEPNKLRINLGRNPLQCSCDTLPFLNWMHGNEEVFQNYKKYTCTYKSNSVDFSQIAKILEELNFECSLHLLLKLSISLLIALVFAVVFAIVLYRYRWEIKFCCLRFIVHKSRYQNLIESTNKYEFDAFVAYHKDDGDWVREELFKNIEVKDSLVGYQGGNERRFKLCIHERDFIPGTPIEENIARAIENSRKTILVLSKSFLESGWCEFELQMACMENINKGRNTIIVVMLEDLPAKKMSGSLRLLIRKNTYIEWSKDEDLKENFWEKMRVALGSVDFTEESPLF